LQDKREEILRIAEKHGARNVRVFGAVVHGEATDDSAIDLLVAEEPEQVLGKRVDVVTSNGLYWLLRRRILKEARSL
jgi:uncharacterized protein